MDAVTSANDSSNSLHKQGIVGGPVTCVSLPCKQYCWVAKGCFLERYSLLDGSQSRCRRHLIFPDGGTIHGLRLHQGTMVVFGGRKVAVFKTRGETLTQRFLTLPEGQENYILASDWIWDLRIASSSQQQQQQQQRDGVILRLALGLANNACELWIIHTDLSAQRTHKIKGAATCITYSMSFHGWHDDSADLILASGTVFNEILIWTVEETDHGNQDAASRREETHRLTGHQGVILSLQFAEDGASLASTSDDRSVRLWKYVEHHWHCAWVSWGHSARVWSVAFSSVGLISTAEDASARIWDLETGSQLGEIRSYSCQSLWRVAVYENWALIGGNDGSAKLYDLHTKAVQSLNTDYNDRTVTKTVLVPDDRPLLSSTKTESDDVPPEKGNKSKPKVASQVIFGMAFCNVRGIQYLIVTTRSGSTLALSFDNVSWSKMSPWWTSSADGIRASDGLCIAINEQKSSLVVGTTRGEVLLSPLENENNETRVTGNARHYKSVQTVSWLDSCRFVTMHIKGISILWDVSQEDQLHPRRIFNTTLPAIPTCCCVDQSRYLVVGDSRGNLAIFNMHGKETEDEEILPLSLGNKFHKKEHVNVVLCHQDRLLSGGNDGCIHESKWNDVNGLQQNLSVPCAALSGLTHMWISENDSVVVAGYHGNLFIALDPKTGYEVFRVDTGGRQRNLDCFLHPASFGVGVCVSRKDGTNEILLQAAFSREGCNTPLQKSFGSTLHGEPIFDVSLFSSKPGANYAMLLTGSEDCTSKILVIKDASVLHSLAVPPQESCIRAVSTSRHRNTSSTLLSICGGKLVVHFYLLVDDTDDKASIPSMELTISFIQVGRFPSTSTVDHRINAVCSVPLESHDGNYWHVVATGDSNGSIHLFLVSENTRQRSALTSFLLAGDLRTVLALHFLRIKDRLLLFGGTTGGDVNVWDLPGNREQYENSASFGCCPVASYQAHQSGTNSIDAHAVSTDATSTRLCICSGGDDQAITISIAIYSGEKAENVTFDLKTVHTTKEASGSAIKGVALTLDNRALSVGYSQRLALWEINDSCELTLVSSTPIDVADVNSLSCCVVDGCCFAAIGGEGIEWQQVTML
jgi:WD40 repeat protein